jgi:hypothetical protein
MFSATFELTIPATELPQTYASDRAAPGSGMYTASASPNLEVRVSLNLPAFVMGAFRHLNGDTFYFRKVSNLHPFSWS